jgi:hypothetical protein
MSGFDWLLLALFWIAPGHVFMCRRLAQPHSMMRLDLAISPLPSVVGGMLLVLVGYLPLALYFRCRP